MKLSFATVVIVASSSAPDYARVVAKKDGMKTSRPSSQPSSKPSRKPSLQPSTRPSQKPSSRPSRKPSQMPSTNPSSAPSKLCDPLDTLIDRLVPAAEQCFNVEINDATQSFVAQEIPDQIDNVLNCVDSQDAVAQAIQGNMKVIWLCPSVTIPVTSPFEIGGKAFEMRCLKYDDILCAFDGTLSTNMFTATTPGTGTNVKFFDISFKNGKVSTAGGVGGAIALRMEGSFTFESCAFEQNSATKGGALYISNKAKAYVNNCQFDANSAGATTPAVTAGEGGAIYLNDNESFLTIKGSTFKDNTVVLAGSDALGPNIFQADTTTPASTIICAGGNSPTSAPLTIVKPKIPVTNPVVYESGTCI